MGFFTDDKKTDSVIFKGKKGDKGKYDDYYVMARGSGNKKSENFGLKGKKVSRTVGLGLKKRYGVHTKRAGNSGYDAEIPRKFFG